MITFIIIFVLFLFIIHRLKNKNIIFQNLNTLLFWNYVLIHELWHWISAILTWWKINSIEMSFTYNQAVKKWYLWSCSFWKRFDNRIFNSFIAYNWELFCIFLVILGWYFYWIWHLEILYYIFSAFFFIYMIYWKTFLDKLVWFLLTIIFFTIDNQILLNYDKWYLDFLNGYNFQLLKEIVALSLLSLIFWWSIINIFELKNEMGQSFKNSSISSDAKIIKNNLKIPLFITYLSWISLLLFSIFLNNYMIFWNKTWIDYIDNKVEKVITFIWFERDEKTLEKNKNRNILKEFLNSKET